MGVLVIMSVYPFLGAGTPKVTSAAWLKFFSDPYYWSVVGTTLRLAAIVTVFSLLLGYPTAYAISKIERPGWALTSYLILFAPILVSVVVRTYGWLLILSHTGVINVALRALGRMVSGGPDLQRDRDHHRYGPYPAALWSSRS